MVKQLKKKVKVSFGSGTTLVTPHYTKTKQYLKLETCPQTKIGEFAEKVKNSPEILLEFSNKESLVLLIDKLLFLQKNF